MKNQFAGDTGDNGNYYSAHHQSKHEANIILEPLKYRFSVCKVMDYSGIDLMKPFC